MKSGTLSRCLTAAALVGLSAIAYAEVRENPYQVIILRNPFALKDPPPPPPPPTNAPADLPPPLDIRLTGISTLLGPPKVFLQVQNQQTKKFEFPPAMEVGEKQGDIEVLAIDADNGVVRIRNGDAETTLDFDKNGVKPAAVAGTPGSPVPPPPVFPGMTPLNIPPPPGAMVPGSPFNSGNRGNVSVSGGQQAASAVPNTPNFGGAIPARPMRSEGANNVMIGGSGAAANPNPAPTVSHTVSTLSPDEIAARIEAHRQLLLEKERQGTAVPGMSKILPPTRFSPPSAPTAPGQ